MSLQGTPLLSPKLDALGVPPKRAAGLLLLWWADYVGSLVGLVSL